jgi:hypothetical protein
LLFVIHSFVKYAALLISFQTDTHQPVFVRLPQHVPCFCSVVASKQWSNTSKESLHRRVI